jgi:hypothetical protein
MEVGAEWRAAAAAGLVTLIACLAVIAATPGDAWWINDEGNKALVAQRLLDTGYRQADFTQPGRAIDPEGRWFPIPPPFALHRGQEFLSAYPLAYPALAAPGLAVWGARGLRLPAALGAAAAAGLLAAWLAPALGPRRALVAGIGLGLATPLFFYGVTVWEHAPATALALGAFLLLSRPQRIAWWAAGTLIGVGVWLREEMAFMAIAAILSALLARAPLRRVAALAAGAALPLAALALFNAALYGDPRGGHVAANLAGGVLAGRGTAGRLSALPGLLGGFGHGSAERWWFTALALGLPLAGAFAPRRARESSWLPLALAAAGLAVWALAAGWMLAGRSRLQELVQHNGLLLQWPLLALAGLGIERVWRDRAWSTTRIGVTAGLLFVGFTLAAGILLPSGFGAQVGAGVHWGPRVLLPALPALVALAAAGAQARPPAAQLAWNALALAGVASTALSVWFLAQQKLEAERFTQRLLAEPQRVILTTNPFLGQQLAPVWRQKAILLALDPGSLRAAAAAIQRAGEPGFLFVAPPGARLSSVLPELPCSVAFQHRGLHLDYFDLDAERCGFAAPSAATAPGLPFAR